MASSCELRAYSWKQNTAFVFVLICYAFLSRGLHVFQTEQTQSLARASNHDGLSPQTQSFWLAQPPRLVAGEVMRRVNLRYGRWQMSHWHFHGGLLAVGTIATILPELTSPAALQRVRGTLFPWAWKGLPEKRDNLSDGCWWLSAQACYAATTQQKGGKAPARGLAMRQMEFCRTYYGVSLTEATAHAQTQHPREIQAKWSESLLMAYTAACTATTRDFSAWEASQCLNETAAEVVRRTNVAMDACASQYRPVMKLGLMVPLGWTGEEVTGKEISEGKHWTERPIIRELSGIKVGAGIKGPSGEVDTTYADGWPLDLLRAFADKDWPKEVVT